MTAGGEGVGSPPRTQANGHGRHPERFDPEQSANTLMDSEHRGRYHWAAQLVAGRSVLDAGCGVGYGSEILAAAGATGVTGVDLHEAAVASAREQYPGETTRFLEGDLTDLDLPDDSFDVAVCFETIEHLESPETGIAELRRVVRPGGMLIVSSPNPSVYPSGNEHHLHELPPDALLEMVEAHFDTTTLFVQHAWLASLIEPAPANGNVGLEVATGIGVRRTTRREPAAATFGIVIGCDEGPGQPSPLLSLGRPFEVRWWEDQVVAASHRADASAVERVEEATKEIAELRAKLGQQEREAARALTLAESREEEAKQLLRKTGAALVDANQELAEAPLLKNRLAEVHREKAELEQVANDVLTSRSWRATSFLRWLSATLKLQR